MVEEDCAVEAETCEQGFCAIVPATHCGLFCDGGQTCPDGMECSSGICLYAP
jgi:hypothetical protein